MPTEICGTTTFDFPSTMEGKIKVTTAEGSTVAIPYQDVMIFVSGRTRELRLDRENKKTWLQILLNE